MDMVGGGGKEPLSFTQHTEIFTDGIISGLGICFVLFCFEMYPRTERENIEETRLATNNQKMKLGDVNIGV